jgi:hypothetical protein
VSDIGVLVALQEIVEELKKANRLLEKVLKKAK